MQKFALAPAALLAPLPAIAQTEEAAAGLAAGGLLLFLIPILVGAIVGWIASLIAKGSGSGFLGNILIGIGGSIVARYLLPAIGLPLSGMVGGFIASIIGAVLLIVVIGLIRKASN